MDKQTRMIIYAGSLVVAATSFMIGLGIGSIIRDGLDQDPKPVRTELTDTLKKSSTDGINCELLIGNETHIAYCNNGKERCYLRKDVPSLEKQFWDCTCDPGEQ